MADALGPLVCDPPILYRGDLLGFAATFGCLPTVPGPNLVCETPKFLHPLQWHLDSEKTGIRRSGMEVRFRRRNSSAGVRNPESLRHLSNQLACPILH